jgi:hypothetical protein
MHWEALSDFSFQFIVAVNYLSPPDFLLVPPWNWKVRKIPTEILTTFFNFPLACEYRNYIFEKKNVVACQLLRHYLMARLPKTFDRVKNVVSYFTRYGTLYRNEHMLLRDLCARHELCNYSDTVMSVMNK